MYFITIEHSLSNLHLTRNEGFTCARMPSPFSTRKHQRLEAAYHAEREAQFAFEILSGIQHPRDEVFEATVLICHYELLSLLDLYYSYYRDFEYLFNSLVVYGVPFDKFFQRIVPWITN